MFNVSVDKEERKSSRIESTDFQQGIEAIQRRSIRVIDTVTAEMQKSSSIGSMRDVSIALRVIHEQSDRSLG
jgi:hypothetical protein